MSIPVLKAALLALVLMGGCTSLTIPGLIAASRLDPLRTDPGAMTAALEVPDTLRLTTGDATLRLSFTDESDALRVDERVALTIRDGASGLTAPRGRNVFSALVADKDRNRLAWAQARILSLRDGGQTGRGSLTVRITGGCLTGPLGDGLPVRTYLADREGVFVPLTRQIDMLDALDPNEASALRARLTDCSDR